MSDLTRRSFIRGTSAGAAVGLGALKMSTAAWAGANDRIRVGVIGFKGRGGEHIKQFCDHANVEVGALCDVDDNIMKNGMSFFEKRGGKVPTAYTDMRQLMDDKSIDVVSIATPNHWHSLAAIWGCQAGKDVYVEKPCSHNVWEGRKLVEAAAKYNRIVQHGTQIRSSVGIQEAVQKLNEGVIGEVYMARGLCYKRRASIGHKEDEPVPAGVDYNIWLGPAPERPFNPNRFHYNWHYFWDYGNGDIGNQGVHQMDIARWGLGVGLPTKISTTSGMYLFDDDKEVPNVITSSFSYPDAGPKGRVLVFEVRPWHTNDEGGAKIGALFYGSEGYMVIDSYDHYQTYLGDKAEPGPSRDEGGDHFGNFLDAVRSRDASSLHAPIEEGHKSAALCHLGLISAKIGRSFDFDPATEQVVGDDEANALLTRNYRAPFVVPEVV